MTDIVLHEKQGVALNSHATEILYGGAAGGGKSYLLRVAAISYAIAVPGIQIYLFRRTWPDLERNHLSGSGSFYELLGPYIAAGEVRIVGKPAVVKFRNGSCIHLCHCQHESDVHNYQGAEIHILLIDELTHFSEYIYRFLRGRVRLGGLKVPKKPPKGLRETLSFRLPKIICGSNPGDVGHQWVKRTFVDYCVPYRLKKLPIEEGGGIRQYIPALLEDNPTMLENDPDYEYKLEGLGNPELVRAMRHGDWDITAGSALEKLKRDTHMIRNFEMPKWWTKFMCMDWGYSHPFSVGWYCVCDDDLELSAKDNWPQRFIPKGSVIRYRELYGWNGEENKGCRMDAAEVANFILEIEEGADEEMDYRIGDSQMWATDNGPSVQQEMYDATDEIFTMVKSKKDRIANYQRIRNAIVGIDGYPRFYATEGCRHFWRTMPSLQLDLLHPEKGPDTKQEDHVYDEVAYALSTEAPIRTMDDRVEEEYKEARRLTDGPRKIGGWNGYA